MPRNYKPSNTKRYKKYDVLAMEAALCDYRSSRCSLADVATKHGISKSVLHRHNTRIMKNHGGQKVLSSEVENYIVENLNYCSEWGYPLDTYDLRLLVKGYLDRVGVLVRRFRDNLPGPDFVKAFLRRHKSKISTRICQNIKKCRAAVSPEVLVEYFDELERSLADVPFANIINYDETNLSDDPGRRKIITKRGAKYPERIMNHSKAANSIMMAASADGTLLPCYVVYKSVHLYTSWMEQGPTDCRYNRTKSGWFDSETFEDWVHTIAMPYFGKLDGKKILIGDNLSSHLSINLIKECKEKNIHFVFLPANSTHLTQPLDVAFFRPVKIAWRNILFNWKKSEGRNLPTVPKHVFPKLLKKLLVKLEDKVESNIKAGFCKTGIVPLNKEKVLERLPGHDAERDDHSKETIDETVLAFLKDMRYNTEIKSTNSKRKKINLKPGQSVCLTDEYQESHATTDTEINDSDLDEGTKDTFTEGDNESNVTINGKRKIGLRNIKQDDNFKKPELPMKRKCKSKTATIIKNTVKTKAEGKETNEDETGIKKSKIFSLLDEKDIPSTSGKFVKGKGIGKKSKKIGPEIHKNQGIQRENNDNFCDNILNENTDEGNHSAESRESQTTNAMKEQVQSDTKNALNNNRIIKNKLEGKENFCPDEDTQTILNNMINETEQIDLNEVDINKLPILFSDDLDCYQEFELDSCELQINKDNFKLENLEDLTDAQEDQNTKRMKDTQQKDTTETYPNKITKKEQPNEKNKISIISDKKISNVEVQKYVSQINYTKKTPFHKISQKKNENFNAKIKEHSNKNDSPKRVAIFAKNENTNSEIADNMERENEEDKIIDKEPKQNKITITNEDPKEREKKTNKKESQQQDLKKYVRNEDKSVINIQELEKRKKKEKHIEKSHVKINSIKDKNKNLKLINKQKNYYNKSSEILEVLLED